MTNEELENRISVLEGEIIKRDKVIEGQNQVIETQLKIIKSMPTSFSSNRLNVVTLPSKVHT